MGSYDSFEHLKHKLWPKDGSGIKLTIWFSTTKSWESPQFPRLQVMCDIPLKSFQQGLQLLFQTSQSKVCTQNYGPPKSRESQLWEFRNSHLGVQKQINIWVLVRWPSTEYTIRGKVVVTLNLPNLGRGESCESMFAMVHPCTKVLQLHINQLIVWFVQVHVNNWSTCHSS